MPVSILYCPQCGRPMSLPDGAMPTTLECPHCQHNFSVNLPRSQRGVPPPLPYALPNVSPRSRLVAGMLGLALGGFGVHRFYLGYVGVGVLQILVTAFTWAASLLIHGYPLGLIWGFLEGLYILAGRMRDARGRAVVEL